MYPGRVEPDGRLLSAIDIFDKCAIMRPLVCYGLAGSGVGCVSRQAVRAPSGRRMTLMMGWPFP